MTAARVPSEGLSVAEVERWYAQLDARARHQRHQREHVLDRMTQANLSYVANTGDLTEINTAIRGLVELVGGLLQEKREQLTPTAIAPAPVRPQLPAPAAAMPTQPQRVPLTDDQLRRGLEA